ncbi:MAG: hypothetical protein ACPGU5_00215 [Lishizhenia sp.]
MYVIFSLQFCLSQETKTISGYHYINEGGEWYFNDIEYGGKYLVIPGIYSIKFKSGTDLSLINGLSSSFNLTKGKKNRSNWYDFDPNIHSSADSIINIA